jgi:PAS domain S-box-containing protein
MDTMDTKRPVANPRAFLAGGGEMGARMRVFEWAQTPLGPPEGWSQSLKTAVQIMLGTQTPIAVFWGADLLLFYNDAGRALLGEKHPQALGWPVREVFPEVWQTIGPVFAGVMRGQGAAGGHDQLLPLDRGSRSGQGWFDYSFNPLLAEDGSVGGVFSIAVEITGRVRAQEALREREERLRLSVENLLDSFGIFSALRDERNQIVDFRVEYANAAACALTGRTRNEYIGKTLLELHPALRRTEIFDWYVLAAEAGKPTIKEGFGFDGTPFGQPGMRYYDFRIARLGDGVIVTGHDATERQRAAEAHRESEQLLQAVLAQLPSGVYIAEAPSGRLLYENDEAARILGHLIIPAEDAADYDRYGSLHKDGAPYASEEHPIARALQGEVIHQEEMLYRRGDGSIIVLSVNAAPVRDADGRIIRAVTTFNDVTELQRARQALRQLNATLEERVEARTRQVREHEERFRKLVEALAQMVWTTDAVGYIVEDSPSWRAFTGQTVDGWLGQGWVDAVHPDERALASENWFRAVATEMPLNSEHRLYHAPSGTWRWTNVRAAPLRDETGKIRGWVGMNIDIDERKRAEETVRELARRLTLAEQEERQRISQVLHDDLQQLLYAVEMQMSMVRPGPAGAASLEKAHAWIKQAITRTRQLTVELSPPILENEGLADALEWLQSQMRELHGLEVTIEAAHSFCLPDRGLRVLLFQIVRELLFNVIKHAGTNRATVRLTEEQGQLVIHVIDAGQGFDPEEVRAREKQAGGFGLFRVRERLELLGGWMEVDSRPGGGTHVEVRVPVENAPTRYRPAQE